MNEPSLFDRARIRTNGERSITNTSAPGSTLCAYFRGKPLDRNSACVRPGCGRPWSEHYPELKRVRGVIQSVCDVCAYPLDSDQHVNHCR